MSFGKDLQQERLKRAVPLEAISQGTKVSLRYLSAIEADEYDRLPGGVFDKGIVRSYCSYLGLDEQYWLARWNSVAPADATGDWTEFAANVKLNRPQARPGIEWKWWGVLLMALALALLSWTAWHFVIAPRVGRPAPALPATAFKANPQN